MSTTAAIKGKMGEYEYFQTTMKSKDVISKTSAAIDISHLRIGKKWVKYQEYKESQILKELWMKSHLI